jgi:hypothetical protein
MRPDGSSGSCCTTIQARRRLSGGVLGGVQTLSDPGQNADSPQVGIDSAGTATMVWTRFDG